MTNPQEESRSLKPYLASQWDDTSPVISPDGKLIAYQARRPERFEIYVNTFPVPTREIPISTNGTQPAWRVDGKELLYVEDARFLMGLPVDTSPTFAVVGPPVKLFEHRELGESRGREYDVSPDGKRFLVVKTLQQPTNVIHFQDFASEKRIANEDRPHRAVFTGVYEMSFGRGKRFGSGVGGFGQRVVGGWQVNGIYTVGSAGASEWGNLLYLGGDLNWNSRGGLQPGDTAFDVTQFNRIPGEQLAQNLRTFNSRFTAYRANPSNTVDFSELKNTRITELVNLNFRAEFFNFFNTPLFDFPNRNSTDGNFGRITRQRNLPRQTQLALRLTW